MKINLSSNISKSLFSSKESLWYKMKTTLMIKFFIFKVLFGYLTKSYCKLKITPKTSMTLKPVLGKEFHKKWLIKIGLTLSSISSKIFTKTKTLWLKRSCSWKSPLSIRSTTRKTLNDMESTNRIKLIFLMHNIFTNMNIIKLTDFIHFFHSCIF